MEMDNDDLEGFYVYALMNKDHEIYIGYTETYQHRVDAHNNNSGSVATKNKGPWYPFLVEFYLSQKDAMKRESTIIRLFESGVFLEQTYWSRAIDQENLGIEHFDGNAKIVNSRRNVKVR